MKTHRSFPRLGLILISISMGIAAAYALTYSYLYHEDYSFIDQISLFIFPAISAAFGMYSLLPLIQRNLAKASAITNIILFGLALLSALILSTSLVQLSLSFFTATLIALTFLFFAGSIPASASLQKEITDKKLLYHITGWVLSTLLVFIITGFLDTFYKTNIEIGVITFFAQILPGTLMYFLAGKLEKVVQQNRFDFLILLGLLLAIFVFIQRFVQYGSEAPELLHTHYFLLEQTLIPTIAAVSFFSFSWQAWALEKMRSFGILKTFKKSKLYRFINENLTGLVFAAAFFAVYLMIATVLNHPVLDVDDIFFDADGMNWRLRLTTDTWQDYYWRSVHPFVLILLKPPIDLVAMLLRGDKLFGAYIVVALAGASCIFLSWKFVNKATGNPVYAALIASILGFSASHLIFGALIESYIFLAASLLLFFLFLLEDKPLPTLMAASLPVIGITHSNFAQNALALFTIKPDLKLMTRYIAVVLALLIQLSLVNNLFYPDAHPFFFTPSSLQAEEDNIFPFNSLRAQAITRALTFHNVVAPALIFYTGDIPFTQYRFFKPEIEKLSLYETPSQIATSWFWFGLLIAAGITFLVKRKEYKTNRFSLVLLGCMAWNVVIHLRYGKELFLYSANWTYALILLLALAWQGLAKHRWFQVVLLIFVFLLMYNNGWMFDTFFYIISTD